MLRRWRLAPRRKCRSWINSGGTATVTSSTPMASCGRWLRTCATFLPRRCSARWWKRPSICSARKPRNVHAGNDEMAGLSARHFLLSIRRYARHSPIPRSHLIPSTTMSSMRDIARGIFDYALAESSVSKAFARHVNCERGILRVRDDLFDLNSYSRVFVVSIGKAGHTLVEALEAQVGSRLE